MDIIHRLILLICVAVNPAMGMDCSEIIKDLLISKNTFNSSSLKSTKLPGVTKVLKNAINAKKLDKDKMYFVILPGNMGEF